MATAPQTLPALERSEIPTLVFGARTHMAYAVAFVIELGDDPEHCRAWLRKIESRITYGHERVGHALVAAFSATGLQKLGLAGDELALFPTAFQSGMTGPGRSRVLGDTGASDPRDWIWGAAGCDAIVILYAEKSSKLRVRRRLFKKCLAMAGFTAPAEIMLGKRERKTVHLGKGAAPAAAGERAQSQYTTEPFGFADGISQPVIRGTPRAAGRKPDEVSPAGAFILGYEGEGEYGGPLSPLIPRNRDPGGILPVVTGDDGITRADLGRNGSFLVVRQLEQDVAAFDTFTARAAEYLSERFFGEDPSNIMPAVPPGLRQEWVAAKLVGRWRNGASLVRHPAAPGAQPDNAFLYRADDPLALGCPLGAHIRRANPRDSLTSNPSVSLAIARRHGVLRVGRPYETPVGGKPGILFMCLNADIELQFETIQQSWLNRPDFHGLRHESDPLAGSPPDPGERVYTVPTSLGPARLKGVLDFVKVIGGGYFFLPSRAAIRYLAGGSRDFKE